MGLGMGTVFLFLIVMIGSMNLMSYIIHRYFPEPPVNEPAPAVSQPDNKKIIAAISAAIQHHRKG